MTSTLDRESLCNGQLFGCRATGATALVKLGAPSADELGFAKSLKVAEIGGTHVIVLEQVRHDT